MVSQEALDIVEKYLKAIKERGIKVDQAYIFGSYARGDFNEWSDIDVAVIIPKYKSDKFDQTMELRKIALEIDTRIEPVVFETNTFTEDNWLPIIYEIKTNGQPVSIAA